MKKPVLVVLLAAALTACSSSDTTTSQSPTEEVTGNPTAGESTIVIPATSAETYTSLPDVSFNGEYQTTAPVDAGTGADTDDTAESDRPTDASAGGIDGGVSAGDVVGGIGPPIPPNQNINPGTLTAGDYDDHLNPHLYQTYAADYLTARGQWVDVPRIDFNNRILIAVSDKDNKPIADAKIEISTNGRVLTLQTAADGETAVYPALDGIPDTFELKVTDRDGLTVQQSVSRQQALDAGRIEVTLATTQQQATTPLDLMLVVDTTGSMSDELSFLQTELSDIINAVTAEQSGIRIGLVFYRDYGDAYIVRAHGFSGDLNSVQLNLNQEQANGGGDYPEAMDQALQAAVGADWRDDSRKVLFLIADAPPHSDRMRATWEAAEQARQKHIHITPIAASGVAEDAEYIMRSVAALTNSRYLFLTDDSGFGAPHAEPEIDCYIVTSLRNAMIRTLNSLLTGVRSEPSINDIIRSVGNYNNGKCEQSQQQQQTGDVSYDVLIDRSVASTGGFSEKRIATITSQSDLDAELASYGESAVSVDFTNGAVLLVDMGQRSSGGYRIELDSIDGFDSHVVANIIFSQPGNNCATTDALTNPYQFIYVETTKEIRAVENTVSYNCTD